MLTDSEPGLEAARRDGKQESQDKRVLVDVIGETDPTFKLCDDWIVNGERRFAMAKAFIDRLLRT